MLTPDIEARVNEITGTIIGAAMAVHTALGPGLLESAYEACMIYELESRGLRVRSQVEVPVIYREVQVDCAFRIDLLVEDIVVVELKAIQELADVHVAQLLSYLKISGKPVGLLINFHELHLRDGIKRLAI